MDADRDSKSIMDPDGGRAEPMVIGGAAGTGMVTFGSVSVMRPVLPHAEATRNIERGRTALANAGPALLRPGVKLRARKGVALYHADPDAPDLLVRELDGVRQRGRLVGGRFVAA